MRRWGVLAFIVVLLGAAGALGWWWWEGRQAPLPDYIASGNGRIEAEEVHIATQYAGRVAEVLVDEGDVVTDGQVLARMDTAETEAQRDAAEAEILRAREAVAGGRALVVQRAAELTFADQEFGRTTYLVQRGHAAQELLDERNVKRDAARAALDAARAQQATAEHGVTSAEAQLRRIEVQLAHAALKAPRAGRVQYRLAEPGEVLPAGGKVVTLLDLTDVFMTIFLPTASAGRAFVGTEARIVLDAAPQYVVPASVSFVASEAQFTPKEVETKSEREKLMFRVKVRIDPAVLAVHREKIKTGLPGEAFLMLGRGGPWPESLAVRLPD